MRTPRVGGRVRRRRSGVDSRKAPKLNAGSGRMLAPFIAGCYRTAMIAFDAVTKSFGGRRAVGPLSMTIPEGQFVALLGGSGCGKTTSLKMINGLVTPDAGSVRVAGEVVGAQPLAGLRRRIGYVFQEVGLFPHM